jgi:hypothetical protein
MSGPRKGSCGFCGAAAVRLKTKKYEEKNICYPCYESLFVSVCSECGKAREIGGKDAVTNLPVCVACLRKKKITKIGMCTGYSCDYIGPAVTVVTPNGRAFCKKCLTRKEKEQKENGCR